YHSPQMSNRLRVQQSLNTLIPRNDRARENRENDDNPSQVLDPPIAETETTARFLACKPERDRKRNCGRGVADVVDGVGKQRNASGKGHDDKLQRGGTDETDE